MRTILLCPPMASNAPRLETFGETWPFRAAYRAAAAACQVAFAQPGVLERTFESPFGPVPGSMLVHLRITELLVHGWDLAHATGQPPGLPDDLAQTELELSRAQLGHAPRDTMPIAG